MDPLSVISGVAGVASAAAALASSLYSIISDIRDAPREMKDIAAGIRDLSDVLRELRKILRDRTELFRKSLFRSIGSATKRIRDFHDEIYELIKSDAVVSRILWAFRRSQADKLLAKIDSLKLTVSLMMSTMSLASEQDKHTTWRNKYGSSRTSKNMDEDERAFLRKQMETLVQATRQSIEDAVSKPAQRDFGTQTESLQDNVLPVAATRLDTAEVVQDVYKDSEINRGHSTEVRRWDDNLDDTARWLYRLVFGDAQVFGSLQKTPVSGLTPSCDSVTRQEAVDRLLLKWTQLEVEEIQEVQTLPPEQGPFPDLDTARKMSYHSGYGSTLTRLEAEGLVEEDEGSKAQEQRTVENNTDEDDSDENDFAGDAADGDDSAEDDIAGGVTEAKPNHPERGPQTKVKAKVETLVATSDALPMFTTSSRTWSKNLIDNPVRLYDCVVCTDECPSQKMAKLKCGHRMCTSCLKRSFRLSITDPQHMPPRCCTAEHIPWEIVERLFDTNFKETWNKKFTEFTARNRLYCPRRNCGEFIRPEDIRYLNDGSKYGKCPKCSMEVSVQRSSKLHGQRDCPEDKDTKAKEDDWQRCFKCQTLVQRHEGCNHMTCRCGAEFCYVCGDPMWKSCPCPRFNYGAVQFSSAEYPDPNKWIPRRRTSAETTIPKAEAVGVDSLPSPIARPPPRRQNSYTMGRATAPPMRVPLGQSQTREPAAFGRTASRNADIQSQSLRGRSSVDDDDHHFSRPRVKKYNVDSDMSTPRVWGRAYRNRHATPGSWDFDSDADADADEWD